MEKNQVKGKTNVAAGSVREKAGELTGDRKMESKGAAQKIEGKGQETFGKAKEAVGDVKKKVTGR